VRATDFDEFVSTLTSATLPCPTEGDPPVSSAKRSREIAAASRKLDELLKTRR
jgi:hypothetical protein